MYTILFLITLYVSDSWLLQRHKQESGYDANEMLCFLFYFFNKSEIRALLSEFANEVIKPENRDLLFGGKSVKTIITNLHSWKELEQAQQAIDVIKKCTDPKGQKNVLNTFKMHIKNKNLKIDNYSQLTIFLEQRFENIKQYIFKKISKVIYTERMKIENKTSY